MNGESLDVKKDRIKDLKQLFPEIITEGNIDWEKAKVHFAENTSFHNERYVLNWAGKSDAIKVLQTPTMATLVPQKSESINWDTTENVFIEGENLEVLKILQKSYYGKIKMIDIDPPYNTGSDSFVYPDRFAESKDDYLKRVGDKDEEGYLIKEGLFRKNSKDNGHYHSNWLSMMYPRLFLARNLLREDGVIFVHIDDNEVHNLRMIMNEIFGEENFIANVIWEKKYTRSNDARWFSDNHDHILVYGKDKELVEFNLQSRTEEQLRAYSNPDNHPKGKWKATPLHAKSGNEASSKPFTFKNGIIWAPPKGTFRRYSNESMKRFDDNDEIWFGVDGKQVPQKKSFLSDVKEGVTPITIWKHQDAGHTHEANNELKDLGLTGVFTNPKPTRLIKLMLDLTTNGDEENIVLDFFAGSCTTAHAVLKSNAEDNGCRQFICVQIPEKCDEHSEAFMQGYKTISSIGKERIRRAINKLGSNDAGKNKLSPNPKKPLGFKSFVLNGSNFKIWRSDLIDSEEELSKQLNSFVDPTKDGTPEENMLLELILKSGLTITATIEEKKTDDKTYFAVDGNELLVVLSGISEKVIGAILDQKPNKVICLDKLFKGNDQLKTNTMLQMKDAKIDFRTI